METIRFQEVHLARREKRSTDPDRPKAAANGAAAAAAWRMRLALPLILLLALILRLGYLSELRHAPDFAAPLADAAFHDYWARALVTGDWTPTDYPDPAIRSTPYLRPPGYPWLLAAIYRVFGVQNYTAVRLVQFAVGLLTLLLTYHLARRLFSETAALCAALFMATHWAFIYYEGELQEPFLLALLIVAIVLTLHDWTIRRAIWRIALAGGLLGIFALVRPNILLVIPFVALWCLWVLRRRQVALPGAALQLGALAAGAALLVLPVTLRNAIVGRDFVLISSNGAINLYIGNNERSDGYTARIPDLKELSGEDAWSWFLYPKIVQGVEARVGRGLRHSEVSAYFNQRAWQFIRANPGQALGLALKRIALFWGPLEVANNKEVHFERWHSAWLRILPGFPLALAGAILGLILLARERKDPAAAEHQLRSRHETIALMLLVIAVYFASFIPFLVAERFRVTLAPLLAIFAGFAVARLITWFRTGERRRAATWAAVGLALFGLAQVRWAAYEPQLAGYLMARGDAYARAQNWPAAEREYRRVIEAKPAYLSAYDTLAAVLERLGRRTEAVDIYHARLRLGPDAEVQHRLGLALLDLGRPVEAEAAFRAALQLRPDFVVAYVNLGRALARQGRLDDAIAAYRQALTIAPALADAHYNLGLALTAQKKPADAEAAYRAAIEANPRFVEAHVNLGVLLAGRGEHDAAISAFQRALDIDPRRFEALYMLSASYYAKGQIELARATLLRALEVRPNDPAAREALRRIDVGGNSP